MLLGRLDPDISSGRVPSPDNSYIRYNLGFCWRKSITVPNLSLRKVSGISYGLQLSESCITTSSDGRIIVLVLFGRTGIPPWTYLSPRGDKISGRNILFIYVTKQQMMGVYDSTYLKVGLWNLT